MLDEREQRITIGTILLWIAAALLPRRRALRPVEPAEGKPKHDHERTDAWPAGVFIVLGGLALLLIFCAFLPSLLLPNISARHHRPEQAVQRFTLPPEPRLQTDPIRDFAARRAAELKVLESSGNGHIAIDRAMRIVAQRGVAPLLPPLPNPAPPATATNPAGPAP